ncbi:hypothetical protein [Algoriphagus yeomjeoni]|uniref:Uncharacterized protein n=1 Tax=Algoriphagus yeomjeoni TaxID=291403 RepID=A0A327P5Q4_9BACT|nr:hypothetical protein [Algoriphagus yeomjeoni]RAI86717.1 hypothetical protein LV83_03273 [Algoriphagus yeomjeoni]
MINKQTMEECQKALLSIRKISYQESNNNAQGRVTGSFFRECRTTITRV